MISKVKDIYVLKAGDIVSLTVPKLKKFIDWQDCKNCTHNCNIGDYIFPVGTSGIVLSKCVDEITDVRFKVYLFKPCKVLDRVIEVNSSQIEKIGTCALSIDRKASCEDCTLQHQCLSNNWGLPRPLEVREYA